MFVSIHRYFWNMCGPKTFDLIADLRIVLELKTKVLILVFFLSHVIGLPYLNGSVFVAKIW